jgi:hypothetical protein
MESTDSKKIYDLSGVHGAEVFRNLSLGLKVTMDDGMVGTIIGNAGDGAILEIRITENPADPSRVGQDEYVYFGEVQEVSDP